MQIPFSVSQRSTGGAQVPEASGFSASSLPVTQHRDARRDHEVAALQVVLIRSTQGRGRKVSIVKFKRRKNYRRHRGHRQSATTVRITNIEV